MLDDEALQRLEALTLRAVSRAVSETFAAFRAEQSEGGADSIESTDARQFNLRIGPLLHAILQQGGSVHRTELSRLGQKYYGTSRGIGGFATGVNPSIRSQGDMRELTERGRSLAEGWWETYGKHAAERGGLQGVREGEGETMESGTLLKPSDIVAEVEAVLRGRAAGKGQSPVFVAAYQILEELSEATRDRLIQERGMPGQGGGTRYAAASVVMQAAQMIPGIEVSYIETRNLKFEVAGHEIRGGYEVCGIYRLQPQAASVDNDA